LVLISYDVVVLNTVEFALQLSNFRAVSIHLVTSTRPIFVDLINDKRGVNVYQEAFNTKFDSNTKTMETSFVLDGVIRGWKMNSEDISEVIPGWRNKKDTYPSTVKVEGSIKVHDTVLGSIG